MESSTGGDRQRRPPIPGRQNSTKEAATAAVVKPHYQPPTPPKDWQQVQSTVVELIGIGTLTIGLGMLFPWLGIAVLGACLIVMGVLLGATSR
jgi:hypothetical protein